MVVFGDADGEGARGPLWNDGALHLNGGGYTGQIRENSLSCALRSVHFIVLYLSKKWEGRKVGM